MSEELNKYIQMNNDGFFMFNGELITESQFGHSLFASLRMDDRNRAFVNFGGIHAYVEAFDDPIILNHVAVDNGLWSGTAPYDFKTQFELESLSLDEWDRFHGITQEGVPFVFSRSGQNDFFNSLSEFTDDTISFNGKIHTPVAWPGVPASEMDSKFWSEKYVDLNPPPWELGKASQPLVEVLPQLKIPRSRILVLGCGQGHDAAHLAECGHIVTAVDISLVAIEKANELYGEKENLNFICADVFEFNPQWEDQFDVVFEHTFYCAVHPKLRNDLVQLWNRYLHDQGHLLGVFFAWPRPMAGPPFAGSEWEIKKRLEKNYRFLYWTRWKNSLYHRRACELVIYAQKT